MGERDPLTTAPYGASGHRSPDYGPSGSYGLAGRGESSANLADILERVLDKGVVIAGDIRINLLDIELLTIKLRLVVASVDKAKEMGIDWWERDPALSSRARGHELDAPGDGGNDSGKERP
ncbi:gas vesicle protein GvpJ [Streptomyces sp. NPDC007917]|uniref:gas vesicle protein n=1 Tax=Streptomyces sp. NPDC007917 TaxID=3364793 RepID=UPI0036E91BB4